MLRAGEAAGPLFGGTLTQLVGSLGTPFAFAPPEGCVLFLEDVNERPYRIDRMLTQLRQSGVLARAAALVFGEMRGCDEPGRRTTAWDVIRGDDDGLCRARRVPVFPPATRRGHAGRCRSAFACASRDSPRPSLVVEESPVE